MTAFAEKRRPIGGPATTTNAVAVDWAEFSRCHWDRHPVRVPCDAPVELQQVYEAAVEAASPFRAGLRYGALPDVRFFLGDGQLRAPGALLPDSTDPTVSDYFDRLDAGANGDGYLLSVVQPLALSFTLWSALRATIAVLWREVGWPNLGAVTEFLIGDRFTQPATLAGAPTHSVLTWVLSGNLDVRVWDEDAGTPPVGVADPLVDVAGALDLRASAGELLYWPASYRYAEIHADRCVAIRIRIPASRRLPFAVLRDLACGAVQPPQGDDDAVPYFPFDNSSTMDGNDAALDRLSTLGERLRKVVAGADLDRTLRVRWVARRSAAGLEPVPAARAGRVWSAEDVMRVSGEIVRMPEQPGRELWAVNGHVFALPVDAAGLMYTALPHDATVSVAELCQAVWSGERAEWVLAVVDKLYRLRGIDLVEGA